ncbi:MAG: hypothetical protein ACLQVN_26600 [Bryobacteraceae bacterium]
MATTSLYESEFENILFQEAARIFPEYHPVPFKVIVLSDDGDAKPDFALIHRDYRSWWVVEAEMGHHSLERHVVPQVRSLSRATYGEPEAQYLCDRAPALDCDRIKQMIKGQQPRVLVVVNVPVSGWREHIRPFGAVLAIFQIFRSRFNRHVYRLNGDFPAENNEIISTCRCWEIHRFLKIDSPAQLEIKRGQTITLHHETGALDWERVDIADAVLLHASRDHPLLKNVVYEIVKQGDGTFAIQPSRVKRM